MRPNAVDYLEHAELALAAYADLAPGVPKLLDEQGEPTSSLTRAQAERFSAQWEVVEQVQGTGLAKGLSVTLFRAVTDVRMGGEAHDIAGPQRSGELLPHCVAVRGTDDRFDIYNDVLAVGLLGGHHFQPQYHALATQVRHWQESGALPGNFTVCGHSLGGFLAGALLEDFEPKVNHAYLYNAPGQHGLIAGLVNKVTGLGGAPEEHEKISNLRAAAGSSLISGLGKAWAPPMLVHTEDQNLREKKAGGAPSSRNHSQQALTDALAVYGVYAKADPTLSLGEITQMVENAPGRAAYKLSSALQQVGTAVTGEAPLIAANEREVFHHVAVDLEVTIRTKLLAGGKISLRDLLPPPAARAAPTLALAPVPEATHTVARESGFDHKTTVTLRGPDPAKFEPDTSGWPASKRQQLLEAAIFRGDVDEVRKQVAAGARVDVAPQWDSPLLDPKLDWVNALSRPAQGAQMHLAGHLLDAGKHLREGESMASKMALAEAALGPPPWKPIPELGLERGLFSGAGFTNDVLGLAMRQNQADMVGEIARRLDRRDPRVRDAITEYARDQYDQNFPMFAALLRGCRGDVLLDDGVTEAKVQVGVGKKIASQPLLIAACMGPPAGRAELLDAMIRAGFDPNLANQKSGLTALMVACEQGDPRAVAALLRGGAQPLTKDVQKLTALDRAKAGVARELAQGYQDLGCAFDDTLRVLEVGIKAASVARHAPVGVKSAVTARRSGAGHGVRSVDVDISLPEHAMDEQANANVEAEAPAAASGTSRRRRGP